MLAVARDAMTACDRSDAMTACDRVVATIERALAMEQKSHPEKDDAIRVPLVGYARAILRMRVRPALTPGWLNNDPVHVAMFGGTNSGKSTVLNVLLGRNAAGMHYRARYSQHPEAFRPTCIGDRFLDAYPSRFTGYQRYLNQHPPRQEDNELRTAGYKPALAIHDLVDLQGAASTATPSPAAIFWDIPDFSTEEAMAYLPAVLDTVAMADLVVMSVTKENYADHRAGLLRAMICASGVPVRVVANKLEDGSYLLDDIKAKLADNGNEACRVAASRVHPLPHVKEDDELRRLTSLSSTREATVLQAAVVEDIGVGRELKKRALAGAVQFLDQRLDDILAPLNAEVQIARHWGEAVTRFAEHDFYRRYRSDYLDAQQYGDFNLAIVQFLDRLELPGLGQLVSGAAKVARMPFRFVMSGLKSIFRGDTPVPKPPEEEVVYNSYQRWLDSLKAEAQAQAAQTGHPAWLQLERQLDSQTFLADLGGKLAKAYLEHRAAMTELITARANILRAYVDARPTLLRVLQGTKFVTDLTATIGATAIGGFDPTDLIIAPLVAPAVRLVLEAVGEQFVEHQKRALKDEQFTAMRKVIDTWMVQPVRDLFPGTVTPQELEAVRQDVALVKEAALKLAEGATS